MGSGGEWGEEPALGLAQQSLVSSPGLARLWPKGLGALLGRASPLLRARDPVTSLPPACWLRSTTHPDTGGFPTQQAPANSFGQIPPPR